MSYAPYGMALLFAFLLWRMYAGNHQRVIAGRAQLLEKCHALLGQPVPGSGGAGYATLSGRRDELKIDLRLEEDHLAMRKIPVLWLHLTIEDPKPMTDGMLDILVRPQNTESYSPGWDWNVAVKPLPGWPSHARYVSKTAPPDLAAIDREVVQLFSDEHVKELIITPRRIRLTWLARQADRGEYLLLRAIHFDSTPIPAETVSSLLGQLLEIRQRLKGHDHGFDR